MTTEAQTATRTITTSDIAAAFREWDRRVMLPDYAYEFNAAAAGLTDNYRRRAAYFEHLLDQVQGGAA